MKLGKKRMVMRPRFKLLSVSGYNVSPSGATSGRHYQGAMPVIWYVQDTACTRESQKMGFNYSGHQKAQRRLEELNAEFDPIVRWEPV